MRKTLSVILAAAAIAGTLAATATDAAAQRRGWGWGPGAALGLFSGLAIGTYLATQPRGYVVYQGYGAPVYRTGCYWSAMPVYDAYGRVVGYSGQPVQVCP